MFSSSALLEAFPYFWSQLTDKLSYKLLKLSEHFGQSVKLNKCQQLLLKTEITKLF